MRFMINHQTHYRYEELVKRCTQYIKMIPQSFGHQIVHHWALSVPGQHQQQLDGFGNIWVTNTTQTPYQQMTIMAQGIVELSEQVPYVTDDRIAPLIYLQNTHSTQCNPEMAQFAYMHFPTRDRQGLIELAERLLEHMPYTPGGTHVGTSAIEAFQQHKGVCQDHSQVFIAMCRQLGYPARYVSGYLYVEEGMHLASHAWAEVYLEGKWYCFDVSNQLFEPKQHIQLSVGRDYYDVAPVRGIRAQGGAETMSSIVQVLTC